MRSFKIKYSLAILIAVVLFMVDRCSKYLAIVFLQNPKIIFPQFLQLEILGNKNFIFYWTLPPLIISALVIVVLLILLYLAYQEWRVQHYGNVFFFLLIFTGAISNLLDRFKFGYVIDFINVPFWSVFNLADVYIVLGVFFLLINILQKKNV
ncbi:MAG: hypothetical protein A2233_04305 [Candidatus Kerfeldbacteria bacterium RIFOXYA2_FULL_38_24]|uniref:Lipoprotein signal peptidase n=1 Tax=Candidatus Kerfeldbacteria bacterium RIFOXYB2_FULL_38_14 TaxID=1798547 RepID=A0A1G2BF92_9BACT|nr:MAG: hypothetical protein A2233_04305 [Candidatus Kerfeldbacteria bacterium RIFOXYA2_FULL_38_24]OGY86940.1 MAG: hypothetical protein A2319_00150 [Candidatus Kerfeldbacteria bacterium RIFOXYB2_FULL_38_14]OGY89944.1 MAG: hypothetical protein A2458_05160 [Candidatus Kerfeldbacteria bacterium RIFOXYC2_FULL_38_9]